MMFFPVIFTAVLGIPTLFLLDGLGVLTESNGGWIGILVGAVYLSFGWVLLIWSES